MIAFLFFLALLLIIYCSFCLLTYKTGREETGRNCFFSVLTAILSAVIFATVLAIIGIYSLKLLSIILLIPGAAGLFALLKTKNALTLKDTVFLFKEIKWNLIVIVIILVCAVLYLALPTTYLIGARDQGLYVIHGVNISNTGTMQIPDDTFIKENYDLLYDAVYFGYPGIHHAENNPGELIPQFLPMFPAALAIGYDLFGIQGMIRVNAVIGLLALLSIYYFAGLLFGKPVAVLALLFMVVNPAQLWTARITLTELLSQLLFFLSVYVFFFAWQKNNRYLAALAGILTGIGCFNRVDTYMLGPAVFMILIYAVLFVKEKYKTALYLAGSMTVLFAVSLFYGFRFHNPYYSFLWNFGALKQIVYLNIAFFAVTAVCVIFSLIFFRRKEIKNLLTLLLDNRAIKWLTALGMALLFVFAYFIRPVLTEGGAWNFRANAMVEFSWYTSFIAVPLAIAGVCLVLRKEFKNRELSYLFLLTGLSCMLIYIYDPSINPDHIWASRRWVTVNIPFIMIMAAFVIHYIYTQIHFTNKKVTNLTACGCAVIIIGYTGYNTLPFAVTPMLKDFDKQYELIVDGLDKDGIYFSNDEGVPGILRYVYGINAYRLRDPNNLDALLSSADHNVYVLNKTNMVNFNPQIDYTNITNHRVHGKYLLPTIGRYPDSTYDHVIDIYLYKAALLNEPADEPMANILPPALFPSRNSVSDDLRISSGDPGFLTYGPYLFIPAGHYTVTMNMELQSYSQDVLGFMDVSTHRGANTPGIIEISSSGLRVNEVVPISLEFTLIEDVSDVEFRLYTGEGTVLQLHDVIISGIRG